MALESGCEVRITWSDQIGRGGVILVALGVVGGAAPVPDQVWVSRLLRICRLELFSNLDGARVVASQKDRVVIDGGVGAPDGDTGITGHSVLLRMGLE